MKYFYKLTSEDKSQVPQIRRRVPLTSTLPHEIRVPHRSGKSCSTPAREVHVPQMKTPAKKVNFRQNPRVLGRLPRQKVIYWELGVVNLTRTGSI